MELEKYNEKFFIKFCNKIDFTNYCWLWKVSKSSNGYGQISYKGTNYLAHRLMWEFLYGKIPNKLCICHKCDNHACVNPSHLFLGTYSDNMLDCSKKKRNPANTNNRKSNTRLNENNKKHLKYLWKTKSYTLTKLAFLFDTTPKDIREILKEQN